MGLKILQLNIWHGAFIDAVVKLVKEREIDILHFQEVTGGTLSTGGQYHVPGASVANKENVGIDVFEELKSRLSYEGKLAVAWRLKNQPYSYFALASFIKPSFKILEEKIIWHKPYKENDDYFKRDFADDPKNSLALKLEIDGEVIWAINTHLAWGPTPKDEPYKLEQAEKLFSFVKTLKEPFILTGDFNLNPTSKVIEWFLGISNNLIEKNNITNTLNPRTHHVKKLFPPGIAVDYIFVSKNLEVKKFEVIDNVDLSDHFALYVEIEI